MNIKRISPRRQLVQIFLMAVLVLTPFLRVNETPLLQLNIQKVEP